MRDIEVPYASWKSLVQSGGLATYYTPSDGTNRNFVWAGTIEYFISSFVEDADYTDWNTTFGGSATQTGTQDEARVKIIEEVLGAELAEKRSADGTPQVGKQNLSLFIPAFQRVDNGSENMAVDGSSAGIPTIVWNGESTYWTPTGTSQGSSSSSAAHSGSDGWDTGVVAANTFTRFDRGADYDIEGNYDELSFWMQPKAYPPGSRLRVRWRNAADDWVSDGLRIEDYVTNMDLNVWQRVQIPMADFNFTGNADKLSFDYRNVANQRFWFDDIKVNTASGGGPYRFHVAAPDATVRYHLTMAVVIIAAPGTNWDPTAFANIASGLENGLLLRHRRLSNSEVLWKFNSKDNVDLFGRFHPQDDITFSNGDLLVGFMVKPGQASVVVTDDDILEWVVRDDLSTLSVVRAYAHFGKEVVS